MTRRHGCDTETNTHNGHQRRTGQCERCITTVTNREGARDTAVHLGGAKVSLVGSVGRGGATGDADPVALDINFRRCAASLHHKGVRVLVTIIIANSHRGGHWANRVGSKK